MPRPERHATWPELLFDLVFVVAIAALGDVLRGDETLAGLARCAGLFVPVWWTWICFTTYADRFDRDDPVFRVALLAAMLAVAALAVSLPGAGRSFVVAYVAARVVLLALYARAHRTVPAARALTRRYLAGFGLALIPWTGSLAVAGPPRYALWAVALAVEIGTPLTAPRRVLQANPLDPAHLTERFGLFTLIVLGETIASATAASAGLRWSVAAAAVVAGGFVIAGCLSWVYFDLLDASHVRRGVGAGMAYFNVHPPLVLGLTAFGAGIERAVAEARRASLTAGERGCLLGGLALTLLALAVLERPGG